MTTNAATILATSDNPWDDFRIDFDKKKLTDLAIACQTRHAHLKPWMSHAILQKYFEGHWRVLATNAIFSLTWGEGQQHVEIRKKAIHDALGNPGYYRDMTLMETLHKGLRKNNTPSRPLMRAGLVPYPQEQISEMLDRFMGWRLNLSKQRLSPLYQALITVYYLFLIQPMGAIQTAFNFVFLHQELQKLGFGVVADYILDFYAAHEDIFADTLASCVHSRDKRYHQQFWFQLFFEAWDHALKTMESNIREYCLNACFTTHLHELFDSKNLNERQFQLIKLLQSDKKVRDKKALNITLWYRSLYKGLTKRTQERDFSVLHEHGFIAMIGKNDFELASD